MSCLPPVRRQPSNPCAVGVRNAEVATEWFVGDKEWLLTAIYQIRSGTYGPRCAPRYGACDLIRHKTSLLSSRRLDDSSVDLFVVRIQPGTYWFEYDALNYHEPLPQHLRKGLYSGE
ncbi:hypothetical protein EVAR_38323_1 [Eumeta japonica]|uniref:Uncharacterized protein n=1 Tax=Eumeta variegata TaxID=151549 RepID=A0A4C1X3H7_EUMVA|nr:hypothetical protein EVAR_38323_1 [Eumeta japonica]